MSRRARDDGGSMPLAVLLSMVTVAVTAVLAASLASRIQETRFQVQRVQALTAAQAGLDVATARIMAAHDTSMLFVVADLPCAIGAARPDIEGVVGAGGSAAYRVDIAYFTEDPHGHADAWLAANGTDCAADSTRFAVLSSTGSDGNDGNSRVLTATFVFPTSSVAGVGNGVARSDGMRPRRKAGYGRRFAAGARVATSTPAIPSSRYRSR
jgi:hypothetical protein